MDIKRFALAVTAVFLTKVVASFLMLILVADQMQRAMATFEGLNSTFNISLFNLVLQLLLFCYFFVKGFKGASLAVGAYFGLGVGTLIQSGALGILPGIKGLAAYDAISLIGADLATWTISGVVLTAVYKSKGTAR